MWANVVSVWGVAKLGSESCKTNPIWTGRRVSAQNKPNLGHPGKKSGGDAQPTKSRSVHNEANLARAPGNGRGSAGPRCPAGVRLCKTNPISPGRGRAPESELD
jgi:hypothetical protein